MRWLRFDPDGRLRREALSRAKDGDYQLLDAIELKHLTGDVDSEVVMIVRRPHCKPILAHRCTSGHHDPMRVVLSVRCDHCGGEGLADHGSECRVCDGIGALGLEDAHRWPLGAEPLQSLRFTTLDGDEAPPAPDFVTHSHPHLRLSQGAPIDRHAANEIIRDAENFMNKGVPA